MSILPLIKNVVSVSGQAVLKDFVCGKGDLENSYIAEKLAEKIPGFAFRKSKSVPFTFFMTVKGKKSTLEAGEVSNAPDAYTLQVTEKEIRVDAKSASGFFYAFITLFKLAEKGSLPCGTYKDEAAVALRMIHWDLKGYQPKCSVMLEELEILASYKVNAILLEVEDKYAYKCAPEVGCPTAYSFKDMRLISRKAALLHIKIIPKLQCIAHVDYVLKHKKYKKLRENDHCYQYCCASTEVDKLWNAMADELMECFAEHTEYFHIGADEAINLGECSKCSKLGPAGSYIRRVDKSISHLLAAGRTPVMWDDILRKGESGMTPEQVKECWSLGKKSILMYWSYGYGGKNNTFPYLKSYLDAGMRVWGASGYSGCDNWAGSLPPLEVRAPNSDAWTKTAREFALPCVCCTGWGRIGSADCPTEPHESCWYTILYAANSMWNGNPMDLTKFIYMLSMELYGEIPEENLVKAIMNIGKNPYMLNNVLDKTFSSRRFAFLNLAAAAESLTVIRNNFCNWNSYYFGKLGKEMEDYRISYMKRWPVLQAENVAKFKVEMEKILKEFYGDFTVEAFMTSRFGFLEKLIADTMALTEKTKNM